MWNMRVFKPVQGYFESAFVMSGWYNNQRQNQLVEVSIQQLEDKTWCVKVSGRTKAMLRIFSSNRGGEAMECFEDILNLKYVTTLWLINASFSYV